MRTPLHERPLAWVDTETTGLDPKNHELLSLALVLTDQRGKELMRWHWKFKPRWVERADPKALEVNGYNPDTWGPTVSIALAMHQFVNITKDAIFCAHNVRFDYSFIAEELHRQGLKWEGYYSTLDTVMLGWYTMSRSNTLNGVSLAALCSFYGVSNDGAHDALRDVERTITVWKYMMGYTAVRFGCDAWFEKWLGWLPSRSPWWRGLPFTR